MGPNMNPLPVLTVLTLLTLLTLLVGCGSAQSRREALQDAAVALVDVMTCGDAGTRQRQRRRAARRARRQQSSPPQGPPTPIDDALYEDTAVERPCQRARRADASERQRQRRAMRRARRRREAPISAPPPSLAEQGRLNEPGAAPTRDGLTRAFDVIEPELRPCAPAGAGRLVVQARLDGSQGVVDGYALYGDAAAEADQACIRSALAGLRFDPFPESLEVYWAMRY